MLEEPDAVGFSTLSLCHVSRASSSPGQKFQTHGCLGFHLSFLFPAVVVSLFYLPVFFLFVCFGCGEHSNCALFMFFLPIGREDRDYS